MNMSVNEEKDLQGIQKPTDLRCEYMANPVGVDVLHPRFSWVLRHSERGRAQSAYQILVASTRENLLNDVGDVWDSEKVESDKSVNVEYEGKSLESKVICYWKVRWWNDKGQVSPFSEVTTFEMGLLTEDDWDAMWIGGGDLLRNQFVIEGEVKQARAYICGLGWYELRINGKKVGDHQLDPGQTDYEKLVLYSTYNVTDLLTEGDNETIAQVLRDWGAINIIVVTLGEKGALLVTGQEAYYQEAFIVNVVDTVGAGDCFCGVFACSLSFGVSVKESLQRASAAAALSVTVRGAQTSMPSADEIDTFLSALAQPKGG